MPYFSCWPTALLFAGLFGPALNEAAFMRPRHEGAARFLQSLQRARQDPGTGGTGVDSGYVKVTEESPKDLEELARDDFVRKCTVAMSVTDEKLLPLKALEKFCSTTTAVYECRTKVEFRLKEVWESGSSMSDYCYSAYDWFQGKYGQNCPAQCDKLQCRATCSWLKEKGQIDARTKELDARKLEVDSLFSKLKEAEGEVSEANKTVRANNFTVSQAATWVTRAEGDAKEAETSNKAAADKVANVTKKLDGLKATQVEMKQKITASQDGLDTLKQEIDMGELQYKNLQSQSQKLKVKIGQSDARVKSLEKEIADTSAEVEYLEGEISKNEATVEEMNAKIEEQNATTLKWVDATETARKHVKKAKEDDAPQTTIDDFEDLEEQQRDRRDKAIDELAKMVRERNAVKQTIKHQNEQISGHTDSIQKLQADIDATEAPVDELQAKEQEIAQKETQLSNQKANASSWADQLDADADTLAKVGRTIEATADDLSYYSDKLKKAASEAERAQGMLDVRTKAYDDAKVKLEKSMKDLSTADDKRAGLQAEYDKNKKELDEGVAENKEELRMLDRRKTEIATEHDLGFLAVFQK